MDDISVYLADHTTANIQDVANMFVGRAELIKECNETTKDETVYDNGCNYTDLCNDADAVGISRIMENKSLYTYLLSDSME